MNSNSKILVSLPTSSLEDTGEPALLAEDNHQAPIEADDTTHEIGPLNHQRSKTSEGDAKPRAGKFSVKPSFVIPGVGSIVAALGSWITPKINTAFHGNPSPLQVQDSPQERYQLPGNHEEAIGDCFSTTDLSRTPKNSGISPPDPLRSIPSFPSAIDAEGSPPSGRPIAFQPKISNVQEIEGKGRKAPSTDLDRNIAHFHPFFSATLNQLSEYGDIKPCENRAETKNYESVGEKANCATDSTIENDLQNSLLDDHRSAAQMQKDRELADQEAAAQAQRSYDQLVWMQREFDEESTRLRADREMALAYARDIEEAMRVDEKLRGEEVVMLQDIEIARRLERTFLEEERKNHQSLEAATRLANSLIEADASINADTVFATQLMEEEERALQKDYALAEQLLADMGEYESSHSSSSDMNATKTDNYNANQSGLQSPVDSRSPLLENSKGSTTTFENKTFPQNGRQQSDTSMLSDRTLAQALFDKEKKRYAEANERWKRDIQVWSDTNKTEPSAVADTLARREKAQAKKKVTPAQRPEVIAAQISVERDVASCALCMDSIPKSQLVRPCKDFYCRPCLEG